MLDEILVGNPKEPFQIKVSLPHHEHNTIRASEQSPPSIAKKSARRHPNTSEDIMLPGPPTPPPLAAAPPPVNRRKSPTPTAAKPAFMAPPPVKHMPHIPQTSESNVSGASEDFNPPLSGLKAGSVASRLESGSANAPQFSSRTNQPPYPPLSALRARTPNSIVAQHEQSLLPPISAPVSQTNFASPLPKPPMSAMPYKLRDRSDSVRSKDSSALEGSRESSIAYERPMRSARASPAPRLTGTGPPLRSANRPGSAMGQRTPAAVAQHEGMI
jgi:hypothetical protein